MLSFRDDNISSGSCVAIAALEKRNQEIVVELQEEWLWKAKVRLRSRPGSTSVEIG